MNGGLTPKNFPLTHHAIAVRGGAEAKEKLFEMLQNSWDISLHGNPDFSYQKFQTMGIDEARTFRELQEKKSLTAAGKKFFVIEADSITVPAQNSLLKVFEEPTPDTHFFLLGAAVKHLIPTLASRLVSMTLDSDSGVSKKQVTVSGFAEEFLLAPVGKRLTMVKKLTDDVKDEKKTKADCVGYLREIEQFLYQRNKVGSKVPDKVLADIELCLGYMTDPSASIKMLFEYVALVTPHIV